MTDDAIPADRMAAFYVQLSDDSRHIRKWDRKPFDGCTAFYAAGFPAPVASADERAREVEDGVAGAKARLSIAAVKARNADDKQAKVDVLVGDLAVLLAAHSDQDRQLSASRPTDAVVVDAAARRIAAKAGAQWPQDATRYRLYATAALATQKPPVDEEARRLIERLASADIDVSGTAAIGINSADIIAASDWLACNLTGDGAGA